MASYLTTATIGEFDLRSHRAGGIRYWDAIDPDLFTPVAPRTGTQFALSQAADLSYKRLARTVAVPASGGTLSFWVTRETEPNWDFMFVEAHTVGSDDWTTLPDLNGHSSPDTGFVCPFWLQLHPFLEHYQTDFGDGTCAATGSTGKWSAASGASDGYEQWKVDLAAYAGKQVELSISYASDDIVNHGGLFVDDITLSSGPGSTSFEDDGDTMDGWTVAGAPAGSEPNANDWIVGTADDAPPTTGEQAEGAFARQPEIIDFLSELYGRYPFDTAGGIVDDVDGLGFALENQTRPIYSKDFFSDRTSPVDSVVVHELAHQWVGDDVALAAWQHIWLNEGFATYSEWLWSEHEGRGTAQEIYDFWTSIPADYAVLERGDRRPRPGRAVRRRGLRPRRRDAARAAARDRRRELLPPAATVDEGARARQRDDPRVHRAGGADLRAGPRRVLHGVAVHGGEAGEPCAGGGARPLGGDRPARRARQRAADGQAVKPAT